MRHAPRPTAWRSHSPGRGRSLSKSSCSGRRSAPAGVVGSRPAAPSWSPGRHGRQRGAPQPRPSSGAGPTLPRAPLDIHGPAPPVAHRPRSRLPPRVVNPRPLHPGGPATHRGRSPAPLRRSAPRAANRRSTQLLRGARPQPYRPPQSGPATKPRSPPRGRRRSDPPIRDNHSRARTYCAEAARPRHLPSQLLAPMTAAAAPEPLQPLTQQAVQGASRAAASRRPPENRRTLPRSVPPLAWRKRDPARP